jgi:serine phosphatase RsbU (regulator of sigma subunit)/integral membrane sensor domain MASE1
MRSAGTGGRVRGWRGPVGVAVLVGAGYGAGLFLAWSLLNADAVAVFFAPAGVTCAGLVLSPRRRWPLILVTVVAVEVAVDVWQGQDARVVWGFAIANTVEPAVGALLLQRVVARLDLSRWRDVGAFLGCCVVVGPMVGGLVGATTITAGLSRPWMGAFLQFWAGDALGVLTVAGAILAWQTPVTQSRQRGSSRPSPLLLLGLAAATVAVTVVGFWPARPPLVFLPMPVLFWVAARYGVQALTVCGAVFALTANVMSAAQHGPWAHLATSPRAESVTLQLFLAVAVLGSWALGIEITGRQHAQAVTATEIALRRKVQEAQNAEQRARRDAEILQGHAASLAQAAGSRDAAAATGECVRAAFGPDGFGVGVVQGDWVSLFFVDGVVSEVERVWQRSPLAVDSPMHEAIRKGVFTELHGYHGRVDRYSRALVQAMNRFASLLYWPLPQSTGVIGLGFTDERHLTARELDLLAAVGNQHAQAMQRALLHEQDLHRRAQAETLQELASLLAAAVTPPEMAEAIAQHAHGFAGAGYAQLALVDPERGVLTLYHGASLAPGPRQRWPQAPLSAPIPITDAVATGTPVVLNSREELASKYPLIIQDAQDSGMESVAVVPIISTSSEALGTLSLAWPEPGQVTAEVLAVMEQIAVRCAGAFARAARAARTAHAAQHEQHLSRLAQAGDLDELCRELPRRTPFLAHTDRVILSVVDQDRQFVIHRHAGADADPRAHAGAEVAASTSTATKAGGQSSPRTGTETPQGTSVQTDSEMTPAGPSVRVETSPLPIEAPPTRPGDSSTSTWSSPLSTRSPVTMTLRSGRPVVMANRQEWERDYPDLPSEFPIGDAVALAAVPVVGAGGAPLGVLLFAWDGDTDLNEHLLHTLDSIARASAAVMSRARELQNQQRARGRAELTALVLAELGKAVTPHQRAQRLVDLLVPRVADYATVEAPHATPPVVALAHREPGMMPILRALREEHAIPPECAHSLARVASGEPDLISIIPEATYTEYALDAATSTRLGTLSPRSHLAVPLISSPDPSASLVLMLGLSDPQRRPYATTDMDFIQQLAERAGLAVQAARLLEREHQTAVRLQQALLPETLAQHPSLTITASYRAGDDSLQVGGDWYDTATLPDGRIAIAVGDIVGRGLEAAATMGRLRAGFAALTPQCANPAELLTRLDRLATTIPAAVCSTMTCLFLNPANGHAHYASAGHPPILLIDPTGKSRYLPDGRSWPLATIDTPRPHDAQTNLDPGATLLMYSDGLIERRHEPLDTGLARLQAAANQHRHTDLTNLCQRIIHDLTRDQKLHDDIVLLGITRHAAATHEPERTATAGAARHVTTTTRIGDGPPEPSRV